MKGEAKVEIISSMPNFGDCLLHLQPVTMICTKKGCEFDRYCCEKCCLLNHKGHVIEETEQYVKILCQKMLSYQPKQKKVQKTLSLIFERLHDDVHQLQEELDYTIEMLRQINLRKVTVIRCILKLGEEQMYDHLCYWGLRENSESYQRLLNEVGQMGLHKKQAIQKYAAWDENIQNQIQKFRNFIANFRDQALDFASLFDFNKLGKSISDSGVKQSPADSPQKLTSPTSPIRKYSDDSIINLQGQQKTQQQILDIILSKDLSQIKLLNIDRNGLGNVGLQKILQNKMQKLEVLIISNNLIENAGLRVLYKLRNNFPNLRVLKIQKNFINIDQIHSQLSDINKAWSKLDITIV